MIRLIDDLKHLGKNSDLGDIVDEMIAGLEFLCPIFFVLCSSIDGTTCIKKLPDIVILYRDR